MTRGLDPACKAWCTQIPPLVSMDGGGWRGRGAAVCGTGKGEKEERPAAVMVVPAVVHTGVAAALEE